MNKSQWDADAQRWDTGKHRAPYAPPPPPRPQFLPHSDQPSPHIPSAGATTGWRPQRATIVVAAAVAVLAAGGAVGWFALDRGDDDRPPATEKDSLPTPGAPSTEEPSATEEPTDSVPEPEGEVPEGHRLAEASDGFTIAVPEDWERSSDENSVFYTSPDEDGLLQIFTITEEGMTPLEAARETSGDLFNRVTDFSELSLGSADGGPENPTGDAAELHYSYYNDEAQGVRECIERFFTATDGERYAVLGCAPAQEWPYQRQLMDTALLHFDPGVP